MLRRFWIEFSNPPQYSVLGLGCGVTGYDKADALKILARTVLLEHPGLEIERVIEDVDTQSLDAGHVRPNMGIPVVRGVWFPLGYAQ